ncbi:cupin domain-containing protein [Corynebacterium aquatimens]|nr:cupin domain-containing protein [Corynebacterium aquatimens]WJY65978.1 Cupin domain protein [Corynebacterium aquatimens]
MPTGNDHGPNPYVVDIEKATLDNEAFRDTLWTGENLQLTVMTIPVGGEIGAEIHDDHDQFLRLEAGELRAMIGASETDLEVDQVVSADWVAFVPAGKWHNFVNEGSEPAKLYSIYAPPEHAPGTFHQTKADADADEQETDGV